MIRNNICLNAHPKGCELLVRRQIAYVKDSVSNRATQNGPKNVLVIGSSAGYGLAARIVAAWGYNANTIGVAFEKAATKKRPATPGWYCTKTFETDARNAGLKAYTIFGDAFSNKIREEVMQLIEQQLGTIDLVIYSLASGLRTDPATEETYRSVLKPIGQHYRSKTIDPIKKELSDVAIDPAAEAEIAATVKVMGGEDWKLWTAALLDNNLFAKGARNVAYSYIGPRLTFAVYRDGTIGRAKEHLEKSATDINTLMRACNGTAYVSINKAVVTRASAVIPVVPLYLAILFKVMKEKSLHEDVIQQMFRLFNERLYTREGAVALDAENRIRIDDWEMREDVQEAVQKIWDTVTQENVTQVSDLSGYTDNFLQIHGFGFAEIDYKQDVAL